MGVSTNAILAFGFDIGEELPEPLHGDDGYFDFIEWAEKQAGMSWQPGDKGYWKRRDAMLAALPVTIETHCSGECPMYFLALAGTVSVARRGFPTTVTLSQPTHEQIETMQEFCVKHGIGWKKPDWHLYSYWG